MKMIDLALIGFGNRAGKYASCLDGRARITVIVEPSAERRAYALETCHIPPEHCFGSFGDFISSGIQVDGVIIASPDRTHYDFARECLRHGWPVLLEKPIATDPLECIRLARLSEQTGVSITVCYELRYHPYFIKLKELAGDPALGRPLSVDWTIDVGLNRMMHTFIRGIWGREKECGPIALSKLCHDVDLLLWMLPGEPSVWHLKGERKFFRAENAPAGAAARCLDCPLEKRCKFSAVDLYLRKREWIRNFIPHAGESVDEMLLRILRESDFGRCVFFSDNDVNDVQTISMTYPDGLKATIRMQCVRRNGLRKARFVFENGTIDAGGSAITVLRKNAAQEVYDFSDVVGSPLHAGADKNMVMEFIESIRSGAPTHTGIAEALQSHLICTSKDSSK